MRIKMVVSPDFQVEIGTKLLHHTHGVCFVCSMGDACAGISLYGIAFPDGDHFDEPGSSLAYSDLVQGDTDDFTIISNKEFVKLLKKQLKESGDYEQ